MKLFQKYRRDFLDDAHLYMAILASKTGQSRRQKVRRDGRNRAHQDAPFFEPRHLLNFQLGLAQLTENRFRARQKKFAKRRKLHCSPQAIEQLRSQFIL